MNRSPGLINQKPFGPGYASFYDLLYRDKNYAGECDVLEEVFSRFACQPVIEILDLGCGTGNHAIQLWQRGYHLTGVDCSAEMLAIAEHKVRSDKNALQGDGARLIRFVNGDIRTVQLGQTFEAVLLMFAVLGYQSTNADVLAALHNAHRHLSPGGLLICDVWYGPSVLSVRPSNMVKVVPTDQGRLIRVASSDLDVRRHCCKVHYQLWHLSADSVIDEVEETHSVRFFFPLELELYLEQTHFELESLSASDDLNRKADETTWDVLIVARNR